MTFKVPFLHKIGNDPRQSRDSNFWDNDLAKLIVIRLARLQSRLNVLCEPDGIDEHDWITPAAFAFEEGVDKALTLHFPCITLCEALGKHEPW
jgi:hypothetical protein